MDIYIRRHRFLDVSYDFFFPEWRATSQAWLCFSASLSNMRQMSNRKWRRQLLLPQPTVLTWSSNSQRWRSHLLYIHLFLMKICCLSIIWTVALLPVISTQFTGRPFHFLCHLSVLRRFNLTPGTGRGTDLDKHKNVRLVKHPNIHELRERGCWLFLHFMICGLCFRRSKVTGRSQMPSSQR